MAALLSALMLFGFSGCAGNPHSGSEPEPIEGGTVDHTDHDAPKVIQSKDISAFYASFYLSNRWTAEDRHTFQFEVKKDDRCILTATENGSGISFPADKELLTALQEVIDEKRLAAMNGVYQVTAGLPPEFQKCVLNVNYASGETLTFTIDNDPMAEWAEAIYTVFADWFSEQGDDSLYPPKETSQVKRIDIDYMESGVRNRYRAIEVGEEKAIEGETHLFGKSVFDAEAQKKISDDYILFPEDFYERITEILVKYDLVVKYDFSYFDHDSGYYGMGNMTPEDEEADSDSVALVLSIEYESGKSICIDTKKASEIEGMKTLIRELFEYYDSLF